jgi:hypothetical protein
VTRGTRRRLGAIVAALCLAAACGLRTPVRPPEDTAPVVPGAPTVAREADATLVRWKRAVRSADGMSLDDLAAFVVERKKSGADTWEAVATIDVVDQEKIRRRKSFHWRDSDPAAADSSYRVIAVTADGQQGPPNEAVPAPVAGAAAAKPDSDEAPAASESEPSDEAPAANASESEPDEAPAEKPASDPPPVLAP